MIRPPCPSNQCRHGESSTDQAIKAQDSLDCQNTPGCALALRGEATDDDIVSAIKLHSAGPFVTAELEGRVLAGQDDAQIAAAMNMTEATVASYVGLYFDVRTRMSTFYWQHVAVFGRRDPHSLTLEDADAFIRLAGQQIGVIGMEAVRDILQFAFKYSANTERAGAQDCSSGVGPMPPGLVSTCGAIAQSKN